ncbi:DUF2917 domain-containing protein [Chitinimonas arctica]|uniref:DUF2917 domain-containing protein n=1 Tax=Chitinimonas arctica TaxID=2594795 RepID=A0A516SJ31_9NEIS|nr:DUF2917 domain-containing protein [Chitinimonas arctica]QDQ28154.1 DUF2917 domain-containing protein [Chitinimonas arctica]
MSNIRPGRRIRFKRWPYRPSGTRWKEREMLYEFIEYEHRLAARQVLSLDSTDGVEIICRQGGIWLTEEQGPDTLLQKGECYLTRGRGRLVIEALQAAQLQILPKRDAGANMIAGVAAALGTVVSAIHRTLEPLVALAKHPSHMHGKAPVRGAGCNCVS